VIYGAFLSHPHCRERREEALDASESLCESQRGTENIVVVCILEISGEFNIVDYIFNHALQRIRN
jgi:hypothetical protein